MGVRPRFSKEKRGLTPILGSILWNTDYEFVFAYFFFEHSAIAAAHFAGFALWSQGQNGRCGYWPG